MICTCIFSFSIYLYSYTLCGSCFASSSCRASSHKAQMDVKVDDGDFDRARNVSRTYRERDATRMEFIYYHFFFSSKQCQIGIVRFIREREIFISAKCKHTQMLRGMTRDARIAARTFVISDWADHHKFSCENMKIKINHFDIYLFISVCAFLCVQ